MDGFAAPTLVEALAMLDEEIAAAEAELSKLQAEVAKLQAERQGVEATLMRFQVKVTSSRPASESASSGEVSPPDRQPVEQVGSSDALGLTGIVRELLRGAEQPLSVAWIVENTDMDGTQVRSALGYLRRKGEAHRVDRGLWRAGSPTDTETAPAGAETVSDIHPTHMKGGGAHGDTVEATAGVRDLHSLRTTVDRDHSDGASVIEAHG